MSDRLDDFIVAMTHLVDRTDNETDLLSKGGRLLKTLLAGDGWLPSDHAAENAERYQQYLLYRDPRERFAVVSFVWAPGQTTPIHDHTVWGLVGVLRGAEIAQAYRRDDGAMTPVGPPARLGPGDVEPLSPRIGDIHRVSNAYDDRVSVSIHVYGADIGTVRRHAFDPDGTAKTFISSYSNKAALRPPITAAA